VNLCPYCSGDKPMDPKLARALGTCPKCDRDLLQANLPPPAAVRRVESFDAHAIEADYSATPVEKTDEPIEHDAHEVLKYAIALVKVVQSVERFTEPDRTRSAILGFMTGSEGLDWVIRRRLGHLFENRIVHVRGLSHKRGNHNPDAELRAALDEFRVRRVERIAVVDEVVSGTQLRTAFLRIRDWHASVGAPRLALHLVGVAERAPEGEEGAREWFALNVLRGDQHALPETLTLTFDIVRTVRLLAMDHNGQPLKDAARANDGSYEARRIWPGGYKIHCPNRLTVAGGASLDVVYSAASLDQLFGVLLYAVFGFGYVREHRWPETINSAGCTECRVLLAEARDLADEVARAAPSPERVPGRVVGPPDVKIWGPDGKLANLDEED
jgi:hypothetical protein